MNYQLPVILLAAGAATACQSQKAGLEIPEKPNVIFIMTDDQGYGDFGFNGNTMMQTPNIDRLAGESMRFTDFHTATSSAPTRSTLMSGRNCNSVGVWHTVMGREILNGETTTLAEIFQNSGYSTAMFGKWHLGDNYPYRPHDRGFDLALWHRGGGVGQTPDYWSNDYFNDTYMTNDTPTKMDGYCTDVFFSEAKKYIKENKENQFFCYISTNAPHAPHNIDPKYAKRFTKSKDLFNPNYYGMIANLDENMGALEQFLKDEGLDKNTIIIFTTDNGTASGAATFDKKTGMMLSGYNAGMRGRKGTAWEGGHRTPLLIRIPGCENSPREISQLTGIVDMAPTLIDMLDLTVNKNQKFDGINIMPILDGSVKEIDRYLFADVQRSEYLDKSSTSSVMKKDWRLMDGTELYNVKNDPGQTVDVAAQYPEIVAELKAEHEKWWDSLEGLNDDAKMAYIPLSNPNSESIEINCHDCHDPLTRPSPYSQTAIRSGQLPAVDTYWAVEVSEDGVYDFELYRWPVEAELNLEATAPEGDNDPGTKNYKEGVAIKGIIGGKITIGDITKEAKVKNPKTEKCVKINGVELKKGKYKMSAIFNRNDGTSFGTQYLKITKK
ncbi:MAG: arylsulfatase [Rikenellaceae bacterium]